MLTCCGSAGQNTFKIRPTEEETNVRRNLLKIMSCKLKKIQLPINDIKLTLHDFATNMQHNPEQTFFLSVKYYF